MNLYHFEYSDLWTFLKSTFHSLKYSFRDVAQIYLSFIISQYIKKKNEINICVWFDSSDQERPARKSTQCVCSGSEDHGLTALKPCNFSPLSSEINTAEQQKDSMYPSPSYKTVKSILKVCWVI